MGRRKSGYIFAQNKPNRHYGVWLAILAFLLTATLAGVLINYGYNSNVSISTERVRIMNLDSSYEGFRVLHLSDLHAGDVAYDTEQWESLFYGTRFDAVVMTGDMVGSSGDFEPLLALIATIQAFNATAPIYFIAGDDDPEPIISTYRGSPEVYNDWVRLAVEAGAIYLDRPIAQTVGKKTVWFVPQSLYDVDAEGMVQTLEIQKLAMEEEGLQYEASTATAYRALCYRLEVMEETVTATKAMLSTDLQIAVNHVPLDTDYIRTSIEWADQSVVFNFRNISLLMAGDYVGGQWRLPGVGAIYSPVLGWFPEDSDLMGMQRINSLNQFISGGLGASETYPMKGRLFNPPSCTILYFTATLL